jgi:hypothetical protein
VPDLRSDPRLSGTRSHSARPQRGSIGGNGRVNRDWLVKGLEAQTFDTDVQVNVGGFLIDVTGVRFDERRQSIVLDLVEDDTKDVVRRLYMG